METGGRHVETSASSFINFMRNIFEMYKIVHIDPTLLRSRNFYKNMLEYRTHILDKFKNALKKPEKYSCPLCKGKIKKSFLALDAYELFECQRCGLVSPNIEFSLVDGKHDVYDDESYIKDTTREIIDTYEYRKNTFAPERLQYILEKMAGVTQKNMHLLDVGCGPGYFISYLKDKGIIYKGLELANFLVTMCKESGLNVEKADLVNEPNNVYNVVTLFDVLEHIGNPVQFFTIINEKLKSGGYILAYTPNIHSFSFTLMQERQNNLYPFQHLCFYDPKSIEYLAQQTGFTVYSIDYYGLDIIDYFCMKTHDDNYDYLSKLQKFISLTQAILDKQKISNHMRIILRKR